jgi:carbon starvation protein
MFIMLAVTFSALAIGAHKLPAKIPACNFGAGSDGLQLLFAVLLFALGAMVAHSGLSKLNNA